MPHENESHVDAGEFLPGLGNPERCWTFQISAVLGGTATAAAHVPNTRH